MPQQNVELARRGYPAVNDAYQTGDFASLRRHLEESLTPDFVLQTSGAWPEHGEWRGHEGMLQFIRQQMEAFDGMWIEPGELIDSGDMLVVELHLGGRARHTGIEIRLAAVHVWTMRAGKAARLQTFADKAQALEAVRPRE